MAESKKLQWVLIDRDREPEIVKRMHVSAYPSLILLGDGDESIHRFSGFKKPEPFLAELAEGRRRFGLYAEGKAYDEPDPRPETVLDGAEVQSFAAPSEELPSGIAFVGDKMFVAQRAQLFALDERGGVAAEHRLTGNVNAICSDGKVLYLLPYGWTMGEPIRVLDPHSGKVVREIVTEANKKNSYSAGFGIAWHDGNLVVYAHGSLHTVDPESGVITHSEKAPVQYGAGLASDGKLLVLADRDGLMWIDPVTCEVKRKLKTNYPLRSIGIRGGALYVMEQPVMGFDKDHKPVRVWPKRMVVWRVVVGKG